MKKRFLNARAKLLFYSLDILFCQILIAFVICLRCLMSRFLRQQFFPFFLTRQRVLQFERVTTLPYPKIHKPKSFQASFIARSLITTKTRGSTCALKIYMRNWNLGISRTTGPTLSAIKREYPYLTLPLPFSLKLLTRDPSGRGIKPIRRETRSK